MWVRKFDSKSLTKTKNWRVRNEVTETSGRLHPLWPQNKWLHTPRITDYRHTIQDRRIQTELAFTLAKNATKPNPFEIIPLQTTRKENNWKTEEALARAAVTVETERIKGSNHWCLWWWWWWWWWWTSCSPRVFKFDLTFYQDLDRKMVKIFTSYMEDIRKGEVRYKIEGKIRCLCVKKKLKMKIYKL